MRRAPSCAIEVFDQQRGEKAHESDADGYAVEDERRIVRMSVVPARSERDEGGAGEKRRPCRTGFFALTPQQRETHQSDDEKRRVRYDVPEMADAEDGTLVGEIVIAARLPNRRQSEVEDRQQRGKNDE